ncbi:MAG: DciA family protein [Nocardioides sp.]|jgi:predicted nucleic acid-binding Zn ribbon protein
MTDTPPEPTAADGLDLAKLITRSLAKAGGRRTTAKRARPRAGRTPRGEFSGPRPDERDPQTLDNLLGRLVRDEGWEVDLKVHSVFGRWGELVGDEVAAHVTPEAFEEGRLVVRTDSTAWATQLKLLAPDVVRRLNTELGHGTITVIEVLGPHLPTWVKGKRSMRDGRGPRDTYG